VRGTSLQVFDGASGEEETIAELGSADAAVSPNGSLVAFVTAGAGDDKDFIENPELKLMEVATGEVSEAGAGFSPSFSPDGKLLAYFEPVGSRKCEGEVCSGDSRVMAGAPGETAREILGPGRWVRLGWAGDRLMVVDQDDPSAVQLISEDVDPTPLDLSAASVWGGSPTGETILLVGANSVEFRALEENGVGSESTLVALNGTLGQGAWAPDGATVAGALIGGAKGGIPRTELATIATEDRPGGRVGIVPDSNGAVGQVVWDSAGKTLAYVRSAPPKGLNLEAVRCDRPPDGACEAVFSWKRGVVLLHLY
jgi:hypothetical protein